MWISVVPRSASPAPKSLALAHVELTDSQKATMTMTDCLRQKVHTDTLSAIHESLNHENQMPSQSWSRCGSVLGARRTSEMAQRLGESLG